MSTTPSTIIVNVKDKVELPLKMALVVMKQIFQFGVKEITLKGDKIFISLSYSPKTSTLLKKFGNLPIHYLRAKLEDEEQYMLFEKAVKKFNFNLDDETYEFQQPAKKIFKLDAKKLPPPQSIPELPEVSPSTSSKMINLEEDENDDDFLNSQRFF